MHRAVGDSIRAIIAFLTGKEPEIARCAEILGFNPSDWLKPIDTIIEEEIEKLREEIAGVSKVEEEREENECIRSLLELGFLLSGRSSWKGLEEHTKIFIINENNIEIENRDLVHFVFSCLYSIISGEPTKSLQNQEGGAIDRCKESILKRIREYQVISEKDEWLRRLECLPFCGRIFESIICLSYLLSNYSNTEVKVMLYPTGREFKETSQVLEKGTLAGVLALTAVSLAEMSHLICDNAEYLIEFLKKAKAKGDLKSELSRRSDEELEEFDWTEFVYEKPRNKVEYHIREKLRDAPHESLSILKAMGFLQDGEDKRFLRALLLNYNDICINKRVFEYLVLSLIARDGIPVMPSHKWIIETNSEDILRKLDNLVGGSLQKRGEESYETKEIDGLIYLDPDVIKRLEWTIPCNELETNQEVLVLLEVTSGKAEKKDINQLKEAVEALSFCMRVPVLGLVIAGSNSSKDDTVIIANLEEFMQVEGRFRTYARILDQVGTKYSNKSIAAFFNLLNHFSNLSK